MWSKLYKRIIKNTAIFLFESVENYSNSEQIVNVLSKFGLPAGAVAGFGNGGGGARFLAKRVTYTRM